MPKHLGPVSLNIDVALDVLDFYAYVKELQEI